MTLVEPFHLVCKLLRVQILVLYDMHEWTTHIGSILGFLNCFIPLKIHSYQTSTYLLFCLCLHSNFNSTFQVKYIANTHFPGSILLHGGIFILITPSTRLYQVHTSQLDNLAYCLCSHFACTYITISAQCFKLNYKCAHFPGPSLLRAGVFTLLTPSNNCVYSCTFLPIS